MKLLAVALLVICAVISLSGAAISDDLDDVSFEEDFGNSEFNENEEDQPPSRRTNGVYPKSDEEKRQMVKRVLDAAMKRPGASSRLGQVLPILRIMTPPQRLALASLVMAQVLAGPDDHPPVVSKSENMTSQLMLPISIDIASMFRGLGRETSTSEQEGRSNNIYAASLYGTRPTGPNIRRPPPTLSSINRRNANVANEKFVSKRRTPRPPIVKKTPPPYVSGLCTNTAHDMCLEMKDYPEDEIRRTVTNEAKPDMLKALSREPSPYRETDPEPKVLERRQSSSGEGSKRQMCSSTVEYARPKKARATSGQWKYIVNTGDYTQTLRLEICSKAKSPCLYLAEDVDSTCEQVYNYHRLLTWDESSGLTMDVFKVPTCCSCRVLGYGGMPFIPQNFETSSQQDHPDTNLVANEDPPPVRVPPPPPSTMSPTTLAPKNGVRLRPYSKRRPPSVQHRGPPLPLENEGIKNPEDFRYPPYDNTLRRVTRNNTSMLDRDRDRDRERYKFNTHLLKPSPNQRHPALPIDSIHADSMPVSEFSPTPPSVTLQSLPPPPPPPVSSPPSKRINYSYHPIIDYFRPQQHSHQMAESRVGIGWTPILDRPRSLNEDGKE